MSYKCKQQDASSSDGRGRFFPWRYNSSSFHVNKGLRRRVISVVSDSFSFDIYPCVTLEQGRVLHGGVSLAQSSISLIVYACRLAECYAQSSRNQTHNTPPYICPWDYQPNRSTKIIAHPSKASNRTTKLQGELLRSLLRVSPSILEVIIRELGDVALCISIFLAYHVWHCRSHLDVSSCC